MDNDFNKDIETLLGLVDYQELQETIFDWTYSCKLDKFVFNEDSFFYVLYELVNYDCVSIFDGQISIEDSNRPEVAEIVAKYASENNISKVYDRLFNR